MATLTFTPSLDGFVMRNEGSTSQEVFSTVRDAAGNVSGTTQPEITARLWAANDTDKWDDLIRLILLFDTSSIPDNSPVTSATLQVYVTVAADETPIGGNFNIFSANPASDTALVDADYGTLGTTAYATAIDPDDMTTSAWNTFTLNATGLAAISKTGKTKLGIREAVFDAGNTTPSWGSRDACKFQFYTRNESGYEPILTITYTVAPTITTQTCQDVVGTTATGRGNITDLGGANATAHGHCWATTADPTTADDSVDNGAASATGTFTSAITGLTAGTGYYTRAFATNAAGTSYGANVYFIASLSRAGYIWAEGSKFHFFDENAVEQMPVNESLYNANTMLSADTDNTPAALSIAASRIVGRKASGNIASMTGAETLALLTGANLDVGAYDVRGQTVTADALTSGRVVFAGASGVLSDDSDFTFATDTLTVTKIGAFQAAGAINFDSQNMTNVDIDSGTLDGVTITAPVLDGTVTNTGATLVLPAHTSGFITSNTSTSLARGATNSYLGLFGGTTAAGAGAHIYAFGKDAAEAGSLRIYTPDAAGTASSLRLTISGKAAWATVTWSTVTHTGFNLAENLNLGANYKVINLVAGSAAADSVRYDQVLLLAGGTMAGDIAMGGNKVLNANLLQLDEITTPGALADHAQLYTKTDNKFYFQDGAGNEHEMGKQAALTTHEGAADPHTGYVLESLFDAHSIIYSISDNTPAQLTVGEQTLVGRITAGNIAALTTTQVRTLLNVADGANAYAHPNHSGEVTSVADGAQTIINDAVTYAKMQNVSATDKVLGRATAGAGDVEEIACTAAGRALLDDADAAAQKTTLSLNNVENTAHSTDAHTMTIDGIDVSTHAVANTGVHGIGASTFATAATLATHAALATHLVSGLIVIWHGTIANIPTGFVICDGNNSTPNLLTKFVQGVATAATDPGATGGAATHALSIAELAAHSHKVGAPAGSSANTQTYTSRATAATVGDSSTTGSGTAHENEPTFYDVAFIMKT